jgi:lipoate-protein ligase A
VLVDPVPRPGPIQLALDQVLLETRQRAIRFWEWGERAIVIGSHQSVANEVELGQAAELGFRVLRRMSGGGAMIVEPGRTITWSICVPAADVAGLSFAESYAALDAWAVRALVALGVPAAHRPLNDIATPRGKLAGSAQARRRGAVLHHTALAYAMDPALVRRLLRIGRPRLSGRGLRSAEKEVSPLQWFCELPQPEVTARLAAAFTAERDAVASTVAPAELAAAARLAAARYELREWTERLP